VRTQSRDDRCGWQVQDLRNHYGTCELLAEIATKCFLLNDLFTSLRKFLSKAHGSFGISACCSVDRELLVLASRGQAMSASFNQEHGVVLWGSEASAQAVPFVGDAADKPQNPTAANRDAEADVGFAVTSGAARGQTNGRVDGEVTCTHRYDLDEDGGEIMEIRVVSDEQALRVQMDQWAACPGALEVFGCKVDELGGYFAPFPSQTGLFLRVYHERSKAFLTKQDFLKEDACVVVVPKSPAPSLAKAPLPDTVAHDLRDIPRALAAIRCEPRIS
jgi:hypothetical protein